MRQTEREQSLEIAKLKKRIAELERDAKRTQNDITAALPDRASTRQAADKTKRPSITRGPKAESAS